MIYLIRAGTERNAGAYYRGTKARWTALRELAWEFNDKATALGMALLLGGRVVRVKEEEGK